MSEDPSDGPEARLLVPVGESVTLRETVAYAVREALAAGEDAEAAADEDVEADADAEDAGPAPEVHFVAPVAWHDVGNVGNEARQEVRSLLDRIEAWAREDAGEAAVAVETAVIGEGEYLFGPGDYAGVLAEYARGRGIERVVVDPQYSPGGNAPLLGSMRAELAEAGFAVEEAPVGRPTRRGRLLRRGGRLQFATLFGVAFLFYQALGGFALSVFDLATGAVSAALVAGLLHRIAFSDRLRLSTLARQAARLGLYVPYLLYEIVKSNVVIASVILHPRLPIEPRTTEVRAAVWGGMPVTTLANSITLTPGTLTVRAEGRKLTVHTLVPSARDDLFDGALERAVRFVFYGRAAAAVPSPREREDCRVLETVTDAAATDGGTDAETEAETDTDGDAAADGTGGEAS